LGFGEANGDWTTANKIFAEAKFLMCNWQSVYRTAKIFLDLPTLTIDGQIGGEYVALVDPEPRAYPTAMGIA
jgi:hypothetical protein